MKSAKNREKKTNQPQGTPIAVFIEAWLTALVPFACFLGAFLSNSQWLVWLAFSGWLLALLNVYIQVPVIVETGKEKWTGLATGLILPRFVLVAKQFFSEGSPWNYFYDQVMLDAGSLILALIVMFVFYKGISGNSSWKDLGIPFVIIILLIFGGTVSGFILLWNEKRTALGPEDGIFFAVSLFLAIRYRIRIMKDLSTSPANPDSFYSGKEFMIMLPLIVWILVPLAGWIIQLISKS
jgi:hypothetical protein